MSAAPHRVLALVGERDVRIPAHVGIEAALALFARSQGRAPEATFGLAPTFESSFATTPLRFVARDPEGQVRAFQLDNHRFFAGTLFQPERRALRGELHPIVRAFLEQT